MTSLSLLEYGSIRVTEDERFSVFDTIEVVGGKKDPRKTWERLQERYTEVALKAHNFQFPGAGQRLTPVASQENILYIIGLLPGTTGQLYREDAAREMCKKLGVDYSAVVVSETFVVSSPDINVATLEVAGRIADGLVQIHKATIARLDRLENLVQGSAVDVKGEVREGNHNLSEELKAVKEEIKAIASKVETPAMVVSHQARQADRNSRAITFHCETEEEYQEFLQLAERSGMSRSKFFLEVNRKALSIGQ